jgi:hypothetical protein
MLLSEYVNRLSETVERLECAEDNDLLTPLQATLAGVALDTYRTKLQAARVSLEGLGDVSVIVDQLSPLQRVDEARDRLDALTEGIKGLDSPAARVLRSVYARRSASLEGKDPAELVDFSGATGGE